MSAPRIVTSCITGPWTIWQAWDDRLGADTSLIGIGDTEAEAIEDFTRQAEEASE